MKKTITILITILLMAIILIVGYGEGLKTNKSLFDTTSIQYSWEEAFPTDEQIRIIGGSVYGDNQIIDEAGNLWDIKKSLSHEKAYLLWISDNGTPEETKDDIIIKIWEEIK